jgi:hypothetical protein
MVPGPSGADAYQRGSFAADVDDVPELNRTARRPSDEG